MIFITLVQAARNYHDNLIIRFENLFCELVSANNRKIIIMASKISLLNTQEMCLLLLALHF